VRTLGQLMPLRGSSLLSTFLARLRSSLRYDQKNTPWGGASSNVWRALLEKEPKLEASIGRYLYVLKGPARLRRGMGHNKEEKHFTSTIQGGGTYDEGLEKRGA